MQSMRRCGIIKSFRVDVLVVLLFIACLMFRKVAPWYAKRFGPVKMFNKRVVQISTRKDFESTLSDYIEWRNQFVDSDGELIERYRQGPMVPTFMQDDKLLAVKKKEIPVPKGPIEVW